MSLVYLKFKLSVLRLVFDFTSLGDFAKVNIENGVGYTGVGYGVDYGLDHGSDHGPDYGLGYGLDCGLDCDLGYGSDCGADCGAS